MSALATTTYVELRKMVDTRAGRWLLVVMAAVGGAAVAAVAIWGDAQEQSLQTYLSFAALPLALLLPVLGIMSATQEWTQRTGLVTFTLEPRRGRVVLAKSLAALVLGVVVLAAAALACAVATLFSTSPQAWDLPGAMAGGVVLAMGIYLLQGLAFGMVFLSTPLAIVASFVLPTVWTIVSTLDERFETAASWLDLSRVTEPLLAGQMAGDDWGRLATSSLLWLGLPMALGTWRILTREVK